MGFPSYDKRSLFIPVGVSPCVYIPMTPVCRRFCRFRSPLISLAWLYLLHIFGSFSSPISVHLRCAAIPANGKLASGGFLASRHEIWFGVTPHSAQQHNRSIFFRFEQHFNNVLKSRQRAVDTATGDGQRATGTTAVNVDVDTQISAMARAKRIQNIHLYTAK